VAKFAAFTHTTLNMPVLELVADFIGAVWDSLQPRDGSTVTRGNAADLTEDDRSEDGQQGASRDTQALVKQLSGVLASAGRRRRAVLFNTPQAAGLGLKERLRMRTIMGVVTDIVEERRKFRETVRDMKEMLGELRELMMERNEDGMVAQIDETMQGWD